MPKTTTPAAEVLAGRIVDRVMTIDQICLSPFNCRINEEDATDTSQLEALILADGLMYPMSIHQMRGSKSKWGAFAGGRRYRSIRNLVQRGAFPANAEWKVREYIGYSEPELIELSIKENLPRRENRDYEIYAGVRRAHALGHDVDRIAAELNQDAAHVARWLRLGQLAKPIFDALAAGSITDKQARAFAGTDDKELQRVTFERLSPVSAISPTPAEIHKALSIGDIRSQRSLLFVGFDAYRAAGGSFEMDLFADVPEERGRVEDQGKLEQLLDAKLSEVRDQVRRTTDRPELRFVGEKPKGEFRGDVDHQLAVSPKVLPEGKLELPSDEVVAHIEIDAEGVPAVSYWWESRKAKFGSERKPAAIKPSVPATPAVPPPASPFEAHQRLEVAGKHEDGASQDSLFALSAVRKVVLRAGLIDDARDGGSVGLDYLVWSQARMLFVPSGKARPRDLGIWSISETYQTGLSHDALELARNQVAGAEAAKICAREVLALTKEPFFTDEDPETAFQAYQDAPYETRTLTAALVAGFALERSLAGAGRHCVIHDVVARAAGIVDDASVRRYWTPTGDMLDMFPKAQRLAIAEPFVDVATIATWAKLKSDALTTGVLNVLTRVGSKGASWVHPLLRFGSAVSADRPDLDANLEEVA